MGFSGDMASPLWGSDDPVPGNRTVSLPEQENTRWNHGARDNLTKNGGVFNKPSPLVLGLAVGAIAGGVLVLLLLVLIYLRRCVTKKKGHDLYFEEIGDHSGTRSAPNTRSSSPQAAKRSGSRHGSPDQRHVRSDSVDSKAMLMRSLTVDMIPDFQLPPERVQPPSEQERRRNSGKSSMLNQSSVLDSFQPDLYCAAQGSMDVEDAELPPSPFGRVWFSIVYDAAVEELKISLVKAKYLRPRDKNNTPRDPFVRLYLLPDDRNYQESRVKKRTVTPKFNEEFIFKVSSAEVMSRTLRLSVYDVDKRRVRHSLGHVFVQLEEADLTGSDVMWRDMEPMSQNSASLGEVSVSLGYMPHTEKLKVVISLARNLRKLEHECDDAVYVRVQLMHGQKVHKTKRTASQQGSADLAYNESILFTVPSKQLDACSVVVCVMLATSGRPGTTCDEEYGRVTLGPHLYARGEELAHWQEMTSQPRVTTTKWHLLQPPPPALTGPH